MEVRNGILPLIAVDILWNSVALKWDQLVEMMGTGVVHVAVSEYTIFTDNTWPVQILQSGWLKLPPQKEQLGSV